MDNASFHHSDRIKQMCSDAGVKLVYLPPYSPDRNPIEEFFAELKSFTRRSFRVYLGSSCGMLRRARSDRRSRGILIDAQTGKERQTLEGHSSWVLSVAFSPNGQTVASGSSDETIKLWDAQTGKERQTLEGRPDSVASIVGQIPSQPDSHISFANDWVAFGNENLIWLPAEYRNFNCSDIQHDRLALGYPSGNVLIIGFRNLPLCWAFFSLSYANPTEHWPV